MKSRVVRFHQTGAPEVLQIENLDIASPGPGEVRIRVQAIGLNRAEAAFRAGQYFEAPQFPARIGYEASGVIEALGPDVTHFAIGDTANTLPGFSMNRYGVYGEHAIVPASMLLQRPASMNAIDAAALWMAYLTAYGALVDIAQLQRGDTVLITAASSSVGLAAIEIAKAIGAVPIAVTRTQAKAAELREVGAAHVIVSSTQDIAAETMRLTENRGAALAFDPIAGPIVDTLAAALKPQGMLILYGNLSGQAMDMRFPFGLAALHGLSLRGYLVFEVINNPQRLRRARDFIIAGLANGSLKPRIAKVFDFDHIVDAHRYLESNEQLGKVVVTVSD
jgi:NADPH:quinone reductase-like Zn-dependent oxidoreductase